jgi:hypothetical protein
MAEKSRLLKRSHDRARLPCRRLDLRHRRSGSAMHGLVAMANAVVSLGLTCHGDQGDSDNHHRESIEDFKAHALHGRQARCLDNGGAVFGQPQ